MISLELSSGGFPEIMTGQFHRLASSILDVLKVGVGGLIRMMFLLICDIGHYLRHGFFPKRHYAITRLPVKARFDVETGIYGAC